MPFAYIRLFSTFFKASKPSGRSQPKFIKNRINKILLFGKQLICERQNVSKEPNDHQTIEMRWKIDGNSNGVWLSVAPIPVEFRIVRGFVCRKVVAVRPAEVVYLLDLVSCHGHCRKTPVHGQWNGKESLRTETSNSKTNK